MSENRLRGSKRDSSDGQKRAVGTPLISLRLALVAISLCPGQEKNMLRESEVQIGNSGLEEGQNEVGPVSCARK